MGYRLDITPKDEYIEMQKGIFNKNNSECFGKLYGYCNEKNLLSFKYLIKINKFRNIDKDTNENYRFFDSHENTTELNNKELREFAKYYLIDWRNMRCSIPLSLEDKEVLKEMRKRFNKLIKLKENVVLWWG